MANAFCGDTDEANAMVNSDIKEDETTMEKVETRGKEVRKCRWEETVRCPRLVGQFSNAGVGDGSVTFHSNFGDSKPG